MNGAPAMETLDCYYWISSDWAYFGNPRMRRIAQDHGLMIRYRPVDLVEVYARTGGIQLPFRSKERKDYRFVEMRRFSELLGMPIVLEPKSPPVTGHLPSCVVIAAQTRGDDVYTLNHAIMQALWVEDRDIEDEAVLAAVIEAAGFESAPLLAAARAPEALAQHRAYTEEAIGRGVFGAPFYFYRGEPFWGQDRLDLLDAAIRRHLHKPPPQLAAAA